MTPRIQRVSLALLAPVPVVLPVDAHATGPAPADTTVIPMQIDTSAAEQVLRGEIPGDGTCARAVRQQFRDKGWDPGAWDRAILGAELPPDAPYAARVGAHRARPDAATTLDAVVRSAPALAAEAVGVVETYLPAPIEPGFSVCVAALGPADAFVTLDAEGQPTLVIDLSAIPADDVATGLRVGLWHELWHVGFHQYTRGAAGWPAPRTPIERLIDGMIDEGIAHEVGLLAYGGTATMRESTRAQIAEHAARHDARFTEEWTWFSTAAPGPEVDLRLEQAVTGPFWDKWGAITAMGWADQAIARRGTASLRDALRIGRSATWVWLISEGHPEDAPGKPVPAGEPVTLRVVPGGLHGFIADGPLLNAQIDDTTVAELVRLGDTGVVFRGKRPGTAVLSYTFDPEHPQQMRVVVGSDAPSTLPVDTLSVGQRRRLDLTGAPDAWVVGDPAVLDVAPCGKGLCVVAKAAGHSEVLVTYESGAPGRWWFDVPAGPRSPSP